MGLTPHARRRLTSLELAQELAEAGVVADRVEVAVLAHVAEVAVAQLDGLAKHLERLLAALEQGKAAREVVVGQRVVRAELDEPAVDLQAFRKAAPERQQVAQDPQDVHVVRNGLEDAAIKVEFKVDLTL